MSSGTGRLPCQLLARVQQALGVEGPLDRLMDVERPRPPLQRQPPSLEQPHAMLSRDRSAQLRHDGEQLLVYLLGRVQLAFAGWIDQHRRVHVALASMPPGAGAK